MKQRLNPICADCSACTLVTHTITGAVMDSSYYQCIAGMDGECQKIYIEDPEVDTNLYDLIREQEAMVKELENADVYDETDLIIAQAKLDVLMQVKIGG
jgi:hypothetical protein